MNIVGGRKLVLKIDWLELVDVDGHMLMLAMRLDVMVRGKQRY